MGRENQEGNEPCFSDIFNTFRETQTTWLAPGKLSKLAQDRCGWRKLLVAYSAATDDDDDDDDEHGRKNE